MESPGWSRLLAGAAAHRGPKLEQRKSIKRKQRRKGGVMDQWLHPHLLLQDGKVD